MDAKKELKDFIEMKGNPGVLLLNGEWGCGKTHLIKEIADEYRGDELLSKLYWLKDYGIPLPCGVDYSKILSGLKERLSKLKQGVIEEPHIGKFLDRSVINTENEAIDDLLEKMNDYVALFKNFLNTSYDAKEKEYEKNSRH